jgi:hypothetical protein
MGKIKKAALPELPVKRLCFFDDRRVTGRAVLIMAKVTDISNVTGYLTKGAAVKQHPLPRYTTFNQCQDRLYLSFHVCRIFPTPVEYSS